MSSILKALKRLEIEQTQQDRVQSLSETVRLKKRRSGKAKLFSRTVKGTGVVILTATIALGAFMGVGTLLKKEGGSIAGKASENDDAPRNAAPVTGNSLRDSGLSQKEAMEKSPPAEMTLKKATLPAVSTAKKARAEKPPIPVRETTGIFPEGNALENQPQQHEVNRRPGPPAPGISLGAESRENAIRTDDASELKLMAIAWSAVPADRIAVINGRIVREGDAVESAVVYRINENEVILQKGDELSKLIFRVQ